MSKKPKVKLVGEDGNIFVLLGITAKALRKAGQEKNAKELMEKVKGCKSYDEALQLIMKYVEVS